MTTTAPVHLNMVALFQSAWSGFLCSLSLCGGACTPAPAQPIPAEVTVPSASGAPAVRATAKASPSPRQGDAFRWLEDAPQAQKEAQKRRRLLLLFFYASWDMSGMQLQKTTFADAAVVAELEKRFVAAKIDMTNEDLRAQSALETYSIKGIPTILVLDLQGREILRQVGFVDAEMLLAQLASAR